MNELKTESYLRNSVSQLESQQSHQKSPINLDEAKEAAKKIGYPVVLRPAFTLGGTGGGFAHNEEELDELGTNAFKLSPVHQVLIEKSVKGYKEIEFEVMRDSEDNAITICGMENIDPVVCTPVILWL